MIHYCSSAVCGAQHHNFFMLDSISGLRRFFFSCHSTIFYRSTISDRLRFALHAHGLRRLRGGGEVVVEGDIAPRSMVPSPMLSMLGSVLGLRRF